VHTLEAPADAFSGEAVRVRLARYGRKDPRQAAFMRSRGWTIDAPLQLVQKVSPMQAALLGPGSAAGSATLQPEVAVLKKRLLAVDGWAVAINPIEDGDRIWDHEPIYEHGQVRKTPSWPRSWANFSLL